MSQCDLCKIAVMASTILLAISLVYHAYLILDLKFLRSGKNKLLDAVECINVVLAITLFCAIVICILIC